MLFPQELGNKAPAEKREGINKAYESEKTAKEYAVSAIKDELAPVWGALD